MPLSNYSIGGSLPFSYGGGGGDALGGGNLASAYSSAYQAALAFNSANYANVMGGYNQALAGIASSYNNSIVPGYANLGQNVQGTIQGIEQSQSQAISDAYAKNTGDAQQSLISKGLGNSTVQSSVSRGLALDKSKADIALANQTAALKAGYQSSIGMAGLGAQAAGVGLQAQTAMSGLGIMAGIRGAYPNLGDYAQMANSRNRGFGGNLARSGGVPTNSGGASVMDQFGRLRNPAVVGGGFGAPVLRQTENGTVGTLKQPGNEGDYLDEHGMTRNGIDDYMNSWGTTSGAPYTGMYEPGGSQGPTRYGPANANNSDEEAPTQRVRGSDAVAVASAVGAGMGGGYDALSSLYGQAATGGGYDDYSGY